MKIRLISLLTLLLFLITACSQDLGEEEKARKDEEAADPILESQEAEEAGAAIDYQTPSSITVLVNKDHPLPEDYEPDDLIVPKVRFPFEADDPKKQMRKEAALALEKLFAAAEAEGHFLFAQSGYRSYERQEVIYASNVKQDGESVANQYSARPGESEHQTGLVMDISVQSIGFVLDESFGDTPEGKWVAAHAHEYGFIVRYDKGKEAITGYQYEPWHLRYVGVDAASKIYEEDITLEEYVGLY